MKNRHNAQNQKFKLVKGLQEEIFFNHFILGGMEIFLVNS